jgi:hypothetical protein
MSHHRIIIDVRTVGDTTRAWATVTDFETGKVSPLAAFEFDDRDEVIGEAFAKYRDTFDQEA